jgi:hypothetical protein
VDYTRERNPDQSRDRDDDDISPQQHGETLSRKLWGNTHLGDKTAVYDAPANHKRKPSMFVFEWRPLLYKR